MSTAPAEQLAPSHAGAIAFDRSLGAPSIKEAATLFVRLLQLIRPYWRPLLQSIALGFIPSGLSIITPYLSKLLIDEVYPAANISLMNVIVAGILCVSVASALVGALRSYFTQFVAARLKAAVSMAFFDHLQHLHIRFYERHRVGEVTSRFNDISSSLSAVSRSFETLLVRGAYVILVPPILMVLNWKLALLALAVVPINAAISLAAAPKLRRNWKQSAEANAELAAFQVEALTNIRTIKSLVLESHTYHVAHIRFQRALDQQLRAGGWSIALGTANTVLRTGGMILTTWVGWSFILRGELTLGSYIAFMAYVGFMTGPISEITSLVSSFQQTAVSLSRMFEYLDLPPEKEPDPQPTGINASRSLRGTISVSKVSYGYHGRSEILKGVTFEVDEGATLAIIGESGAGKSTVLKLLAGYEYPTDGVVTIGGEDTRSISPQHLRRNVAVVWQDFGLMKGTVWDNLTIGASAVHRGDVEAAVRACSLLDDIMQLPERYATPIGEGGATLSGGQRQRLAIARALLQDPPVLILDEATSFLDFATEQRVLENLLAARKGRTLVYVSHRMANVMLADRIALLADGRIAALGSHADLMASNAEYRRMHHIAMHGPSQRSVHLVGE